MHPTWHVLVARPQHEAAVAEALTAAGLVPLVLMREVWKRRIRGRRKVLTRTPLLAGYLFLAQPIIDWRAVLAVPDVHGVLAMDGAPAVVADSELREMRKAAGKAPIAAGSRVEVEAGPFAGHMVEVRGVDVGRRSITADVALLGSRRPVQISVDSLAA